MARAERLLVSVLTWMLMIGLHVFRNAFAANRPGGLKYLVTCAIALASTAYMAFHGRSVIRTHFGAQGGRDLTIAPRQALAVIAFMLGFGVYFAWIMS